MKKILALGLISGLLGCGKVESPATPGPASFNEAPTYKGKPLSHWIELTKDPDPRRRAKATEVLSFFGAEETVPVLIEALSDEDKEVRSGAAEALGAIGPQAKEALPQLTNALRDKSALVRVRVAGALWQ